MISVALLFGLVVLPLVMVLVLRSNGAVAFLSVCLGSVLVATVSSDVIDFTAAFTPLGDEIVDDWTKVALLLLPLLIGLFVTRKSVGASKQAINFIPALAAGLLLALFAVPLLPSGVEKTIAGTDYWDMLQNLKTLIILGGAAMSFGLLLIARPRHKEEDKKH